MNEIAKPRRSIIANSILIAYPNQAKGVAQLEQIMPGISGSTVAVDTYITLTAAHLKSSLPSIYDNVVGRPNVNSGISIKVGPAEITSTKTTVTHSIGLKDGSVNFTKTELVEVRKQMGKLTSEHLPL